jgi:hypothetical protein
VKILIPTCDKYAHVVPPHVHYLRKLWPQCPYEVIVLTTENPINVDATVICLGKDRGFANNLHLFFNRYMKDDLMMLCLDDLIPMELHLRRLDRALEVLENDHTVYMVRLSKRFTTEGVPYARDTLFVEMNKRDFYLFSQKGTIWRTDIFRRLLRKDAHPWGAEIAGGNRAKRLPGRFLGAAKPILVQRNLYEHGKLDKKSFQWIQDNW